jgi:hypothetical protein
MKPRCHKHTGTRGSAPATPGFTAVAPKWMRTAGTAQTAPAIPASESTLGSHPCVALSSAQVLPEWIPSTPPINAFAANGNNPLSFVSHSRGSLQFRSGLVYDYFGVPGDVHETLLLAPSIGACFNKLIRGYFPYSRVCPARSEVRREGER